MMTLDEAIAKYDEVANILTKRGEDQTERMVAAQYRQLVGWLTELKTYREKDDDGR